MQIRPRASGVEILAPAKINLFFEVLSKRDDGFHEIETLMVPISVFDTLVMEDDPTGQFSIAPRWSVGMVNDRIPPPQGNQPVQNPGDIPGDERNIVVRAVRLLAERAGIQRGAKLQLIKRIPAAAGLGGGSSDAAAALVAANLVWKLGWRPTQLADVAAELGSDVPFFLGCGPAICRGRGEKIEPVTGLGDLSFVLVRPPEGLATAAVYRQCRPGSPPTRCEQVLDSVRRKNWRQIGAVVHNRLIDSARQLSAWIDCVLERLKSEYCPAIGMSGSGSTCFAVCHSARHARHVAGRLSTMAAENCWVQQVRSA